MPGGMKGNHEKSQARWVGPCLRFDLEYHAYKPVLATQLLFLVWLGLETEFFDMITWCLLELLTTLLNKLQMIDLMPVMVAKRSKAWTFFARMDAGTVGWNPTQGMDV
jgi:hypothetical protein